MVPADLLARCFQQALTFVELYTQSKIEEVALKAGLTKAEIIPQLQQAQLPPDRKVLMGELLPLVLEEWGIDPQLSPTAALLGLTIPYAFAASSAYMTLAKLAGMREMRPISTVENGAARGNSNGGNSKD